MKRTLPLLLATLLLSSAAEAREVYRCRTPDGALRFGDTPCEASAPDQVTTTLADPSAAQRRKDLVQAQARARGYAESDTRRVAELEHESTRHLPVSLGGAANPLAARHAEPMFRPDAKARACATAKAKRERAYREHGNDMSFDARRHLQDRMSAACGR